MPPKRKAPNAASANNYTDPFGDRANKRSRVSQPLTKPKSQIPAEPLVARNEENGGPGEKVAAEAVKAEQQEGERKEEEVIFDHSRPEEVSGIVDRRYYPAEMSNERCAQYNNNEIPRPIERLHSAIKATASACKAIRESKSGDAVMHWFKRDLRIRDNTGLSKASALAEELGCGVVGVWILSPQDWDAHLVSPAKCDFELRSVAVLRQELSELDIPLHIEVVEKRRDVPARLVQLAKQWSVKSVFCNIEYEPDELRREEKLVRLMVEEGIEFAPQHDDCVVPPGTLKTGGGKQYAVYSPWYRSWVSYLHAHPYVLDERPMPSKNPPSFREQYKYLFDAKTPEAPKSKQLPSDDRDRLHHLYPAGEAAALDRLQRFLKEKIGAYKDTRNFPSRNSTARLSVHHAAGTLAARTSVRLARDVNSTRKLDGGNPGVQSWISEVAWRDFYRHVLCHWPYVCMHKPFKFEYTNITWEYSDPHLLAWKTGQTGYPLIDAAMRCMNHTSYMHNRLRMVTASFLAKHLLLDWRLGEQHFMLSFVDGDFAANNGGWGFASSTGVDPQPYFRVFNPWLQSEKFDAQGEFIKTWVPELRGVDGMEVHNPYAKSGSRAAALAERNGYPRPIVEHRFARERCLERFKLGIGRATA
ncbi:hypothetical protein EKO04_011446 [Ascochyta lentis]|uniref:Photolyase/cryptochrome alpha/beta domain-containing protein n=1 Tax=Ascochyta lentis TaxID=205686 RepID=A0A8H7ITF8_9PLEO|nr:hypothetical protein EKO04_011446 [Ascochyta lentis]